MPKYAVIAVYQCEISGSTIPSIDVQCLFVKANGSRRAIEKVKAIKIHKYKNELGESVKWRPLNIFSAGKIDDCGDLDEIVGFIANKNELFKNIGSSKKRGANQSLKGRM